MPYIKEMERIMVDPLIGDMGRASSPGHLNFQLTRICTDYLADKINNYQHYNDVIGALEACKLEFYRRTVAPYEDKKIKENGDLY